MQGQYPGNGSVRLRGACRSVHHEVRSAWLLCAACRTQSSDLQLLRSRPNLLHRAPGTAHNQRAAGGGSRTPIGRAAIGMICRRPVRRRCQRRSHHGGATPRGFALPLVGRRCPEFVRREFLRRRLGRRGLIRHDRTGSEHGPIMPRSGASAPSPVGCTCIIVVTRVLAQAGLPRIGSTNTRPMSIARRGAGQRPVGNEDRYFNPCEPE